MGAGISYPVVRPFVHDGIRSQHSNSSVTRKSYTSYTETFSTDISEEVMSFDQDTV